jgi:hypothetical protein
VLEVAGGTWAFIDVNYALIALKKVISGLWLSVYGG